MPMYTNVNKQQYAFVSLKFFGAALTHGHGK